jgi:hypothetical protein
VKFTLSARIIAEQECGMETGIHQLEDLILNVTH